MSEHRVLPHGSTGIAIPVATDDSHLDTAVELERLGFDTLWIAGGQLDRLTRVDDLVRATSGVRIATGIVPLGVFDTAAIAASHHRLDAADPGRFVLGLGGPQQAKPLGALHGYLAELDAAGVAPHQRLLAALGPKKLRIAAERSAGAITLLTSPGSTAAARRALGDGPTLAVQQLAVFETDPVRARDAVRGTLGFLAQVGGYRAEFARQGFGDAEVNALSDRLIDTVVAHGDAYEIAARVRAHREAGADHVAVSLALSEGGAGLLDAAPDLAGALALVSA